MKRVVGIASLLVCCCVACWGEARAAVAAETVSLDGAQGAVTVPVAPARLVIMDYGMLDTLDAFKTAGLISKDVQIALPKANIPAYLSAYTSDACVDIGNLKDFNLETIFAFKPDLIITSGRQQDFFEELKAIAPVWQMNSLPSPYLEGAMRNILSMGSIFGVEEGVEQALANLEASAAEVRELAGAKGWKALVLLTNDGKISAYGSGSRFGLIYDALGLGQADASIRVGIHGQLVNYEYIAKTDPDVIFVVDRSVAVTGKADGVRILNNELVNGTKAAREGRIIPLDPSVWYLSGGGLTSLGLMIGEVRQALER